jgi:hypothetical protein
VARKIFLNRLVSMIMALLLIVGLIIGLAAGVMLMPAGVDAKGPVSLRDASTAGQLTGVALLDKSTPKPVMTGKKALFVDGAFYEKADSSVVKQVSDVVKSGVPVVIFGNGMEKLRGALGSNIPYQTAQYDINGSITDIPIAAYGIKMYPGAKNSDGAPVFGIITVAGGPDDISNAVSIAQEWAGSKVSDVLSQAVDNQASEAVSADEGVLAAAAAPYWGPATQSQFSTADNWKIYGRLNILCNWKTLQNDGSSAYDWRDLALQVQTVPGVSPNLYKSTYRNADIWASVDVNEVVSSYMLVDYDPTTTSGASSVGVSIGVNFGDKGAAVSASDSWSYSISDVVVHDQSDYYTGLASWWHDIDQTKTVGSSSYQIKPGLIYRCGNGQMTTIRQRYQAQYGTPIGWPLPWKYWKSPVVILTNYNM